jgi:hypothetical protein
MYSYSINQLPAKLQVLIFGQLVTTSSTDERTVPCPRAWVCVLCFISELISETTELRLRRWIQFKVRFNSFHVLIRLMDDFIILMNYNHTSPDDKSFYPNKTYIWSAMSCICSSDYVIIDDQLCLILDLYMLTSFANILMHNTSWALGTKLHYQLMPCICLCILQFVLLLLLFVYANQDTWYLMLFVCR